MKEFSSKRHLDEFFEEYKIRRKAFDTAVKQHLKGTLWYNCHKDYDHINERITKGRPYVNPSRHEGG